MIVHTSNRKLWAAAVAIMALAHLQLLQTYTRCDAFALISNLRQYRAITASQLHARKNIMPKFTEAEQEELQRILAGEQIDNTDNSHEKWNSHEDSDKGNAQPQPTKSTNTQQAGKQKPWSKRKDFNQRANEKRPPPRQQLQQRRPQASKASPMPVKLQPTNPNTADTSSSRKSDSLSSRNSALSPDNRKIKKKPSTNSGSSGGGSGSGLWKGLSDLDFDYDDLEAAMNEIDGGGFNPMGGVIMKVSDESVEHDGLHAGDTVRASIWQKVRGHDGQLLSSFSRVHKDMNDIVIFYADPRRMTSEFRDMLVQLDNIPTGPLKVALVAINCDDSNDHRKFKKKTMLSSTVLLNDVSRQLMEALRCKTNQRIASALGMLEVSTGKIVKIWYEGDWDPSTTKDLTVEEVTSYRHNPQQFLEAQIGIR